MRNGHLDRNTYAHVQAQYNKCCYLLFTLSWGFEFWGSHQEYSHQRTKVPCLKIVDGEVFTDESCSFLKKTLVSTERSSKNITRKLAYTAITFIHNKLKWLIKKYFNKFEKLLKSHNYLVRGMENENDKTWFQKGSFGVMLFLPARVCNSSFLPSSLILLLFAPILQISATVYTINVRIHSTTK